MTVDVVDRVHMIDVGEKPETEREAIARGRIFLHRETLDVIRRGGLAKGDVLAAAQVAGILAAKETSHLIPLCHPLLMNQVEVSFYLPEDGDSVEITSRVKGNGKTGYEMEALTAVSVAALTIYDMCKAIDQGMIIDQVHLVRKSGGKSGTVVYEDVEEHAASGKVVALAVNARRGETKQPVERVTLREGFGIVGDGHGGSERQVSLLARETEERLLAALEGLNPERFPEAGIYIHPGEAAENFLTEGLELVTLPVGTRLAVGPEAVLEITEIGKRFHRPGFYLLPLEGVFAEVVHGGDVQVGDEIRVIQG